MAKKFYPVSEPSITNLEKEYVAKAMESEWVSSQGDYVPAFEEGFANYCGVDHGVSTTSGTTALFLALKALNIGPRDEVIVPSLTFVAVPAAVAQVGATPVLIDADPDTWCMNPGLIEKAVTPRTKAIIAVHLYGQPCYMTLIMNVAKHYGLKVIEDCAEAHGALYEDKKVGSIGHIGCFSFYANKIITTGEGGMCITNDYQLALRMRFLSSHAMDKEQTYFHPEVGYNLRMANLQAALGCAQLERINELIVKRERILNWYSEALDLKLNPRAPYGTSVNWMVCALLPDYSYKRDEILDELLNEGIDTRPFFIPAHHMPPYAHCRCVGDMNPKANLSPRGFNLPSSPNLTEDDVAFITGKLVKALG